MRANTSRALMRRHFLRLLKRAAVSKARGDPGRAEAMVPIVPIVRNAV
jgi:hypothetical protein